jgi:molybdopterin-guanine dinucleotide biosynthesis protein A
LKESRPGKRPGGVRGAILAGGGATRFGGKPKGLEVVGGERILDRLVRVMTAAFDGPPLLVANAPEASTWRPGLQVVPDVRPGFGALGGIYTAVVAAPAPVVCVAWDMPFVSETLLRRLADGLVGNDACLPQSTARHGVEPLCAAYGPACRDAIARSLDEGDLRAVSFHERIGIGILPLSEIARLGDPELLFFNVNTAEDLALTDGMWRRLESSPSSGGRTPERPR